MAKLVVLIHGLIDSKTPLWMGAGEIIYLGVICMQVLTTLTWLTSPGVSCSCSLSLAHCPSWHLWLSSPCCCLLTHTGTHFPLPTLLPAHWLLLCSLSLCRQMALGRTSHPPVSSRDAALHWLHTYTLLPLLANFQKALQGQNSQNTRDNPKKESPPSSHLISS